MLVVTNFSALLRSTLLVYRSVRGEVVEALF
jgi:hypothetical protein